MTPHDHTTHVPGCYRCELGRDEVERQARVECACDPPDADDVYTDVRTGRLMCEWCDAPLTGTEPT